MFSIYVSLVSEQRVTWVTSRFFGCIILILLLLCGSTHKVTGGTGNHFSWLPVWEQPSRDGRWGGLPLKRNGIIMVVLLCCPPLGGRVILGVIVLRFEEGAAREPDAAPGMSINFLEHFPPETPIALVGDANELSVR